MLLYRSPITPLFPPLSHYIYNSPIHVIIIIIIITSKILSVTRFGQLLLSSQRSSKQ